MLLMEDIRRLSHNLNVFNCCHIYREENRTIDCLANKGGYSTNSNIWWSEFPRNVKKFAFEDYCELSLPSL